jgi:L-ascorbate metabolism protein UlaG (beta-lactamase superfamily)
MIVTYHGIESFKISQGDLTLALNPISKESKNGTPTRFGADVTLISTNHPDTAGRDQTSRGDKESFVIDGPGEYEVRDITIKGFRSEGPEDLINTIYLISFEGMKICFLGSLSSPTLSPESLEVLEDIDLLIVPVGGEDARVLDPAAGYKLAVSLEPKMITPMHYDKKSLELFLKEAGKDKAEPVDKLVVKKKDFEGKQGEVVVITEE